MDEQLSQRPSRPTARPLSRRAFVLRALTLGLAAGGVATLAACGEQVAKTVTTAVAAGLATPDSPAGQSTATRPGPATPVGTPSSASGATGVTATEIKLGTWGPQDGPAGAYGVLSRTIAAYFKQLNASGGIAGRTITLINENDSYQPAKTAVAVAKLVEQDRVFALIGGIGNQHNLQVLDYLVQRQVPHIAPATGSGLLSRPTRPTIFCVQPNYTSEATLLARYALDTLGAKKLAVFFQDDVTGREGRDALQAELRRRGLGAAVDVSYAATDRNYSAQALRIQASNVDAVVLYAVPQAGGGVIQELTKIGAKSRLLASSLIADPAIFDLAGPGIDGLIIGSWLVDYNDKTNPQGSEFRAWLQANLPNERPDSFAAAGYAYATLMAELLRRTGPDLSRERFLQTANALQNYADSLAPRFSYAPDDHQGVKGLYFQQARFADKTFIKLTDFIELT